METSSGGLSVGRVVLKRSDQDRAKTEPDDERQTGEHLARQAHDPRRIGPQAQVGGDVALRPGWPPRVFVRLVHVAHRRAASVRTIRTRFCAVAEPQLGRGEQPIDDHVSCAARGS